MMMTLAFRAAARVEAQIAVTARNDEPDIAVSQAVFAAPTQPAPPAFLRTVSGMSSMIELGRIVQPVEMFLASEDVAVINANALENAVAVQKSVIIDGNFCIFLS